MSRTWREAAYAVIRSVIAAHPHLDRRDPELRRLANEAYPFGPRSHWPK